jgi:hypothetical protein
MIEQEWIPETLFFNSTLAWLIAHKYFTTF